MFTRIEDGLPEPDEDILFVDMNYFPECSYTGLPIKPTVHYGFRDKFAGGHFRSYMDVRDKWKATHWMYTSDLLDHIKI